MVLQTAITIKGSTSFKWKWQIALVREQCPEQRLFCPENQSCCKGVVSSIIHIVNAWVELHSWTNLSMNKMVNIL